MREVYISRGGCLTHLRNVVKPHVLFSLTWKRDMSPGANIYWISAAGPCSSPKQRLCSLCCKVPQLCREIPNKKNDITLNFPCPCFFFSYILALRSLCGKCCRGRFHLKVINCHCLPLFSWSLMVLPDCLLICVCVCVQRWPTPCRSCSVYFTGRVLIPVWAVCLRASPAETRSSVWWRTGGPLTLMTGRPSSVRRTLNLWGRLQSVALVQPLFQWSKDDFALCVKKYANYFTLTERWLWISFLLLKVVSQNQLHSTEQMYEPSDVFHSDIYGKCSCHSQKIGNKGSIVMRSLPFQSVWSSWSPWWESTTRSTSWRLCWRSRGRRSVGSFSTLMCKLIIEISWGMKGVRCFKD